MAFIGALILAPLAVTVLTFWAYLPIVALIFGGPIYLVTGGPMLWWYLSRYPPAAHKTAGLAAFTAAIVAIVFTLLSLSNDWIFLAEELARLAVISMIFAAMWGGTFSWIYIKLRRDFQL